MFVVSAQAVSGSGGVDYRRRKSIFAKMRDGTETILGTETRKRARGRVALSRSGHLYGGFVYSPLSVEMDI